MIHAKTKQESNYLPAVCLYRLRTRVKSMRRNRSIDNFFIILIGIFLVTEYIYIYIYINEGMMSYQCIFMFMEILSSVKCILCYML